MNTLETLEIPQSEQSVVIGALDEILKALSPASVAVRPEYIQHEAHDAPRKYLGRFNGIMDDGTPHLDANVLRRFSERNPVLRAIINTFKIDVGAHFVLPKDEDAVGIKIEQKDTNKGVTAATAAKAEMIRDILLQGGLPTEHKKTGRVGVWDGQYKVRADPLPVLINKIVEDMLTLDRVFLSIEGSPVYRGKRPHPVMFFRAEDAALMRLVDPDVYKARIRKDREGEIEYVMLDPGFGWAVLREYRWEDGDLGVYNPRTEWNSFGYGRSPVEECLDAVLGIQWAIDANKQFFNANHVPLGVLSLIGNYEPDTLKKIALHFRQRIGTPGNYYEFPILRAQAGQGSAATWTPMMQRDRQDMVFYQFITFCVAVMSAVFAIAPEEYGFASYGGPSSTLNQPDPESVIENGARRGRLPRVLWIADFLSRNIVEKIDSDFKLTIQGLEARYHPEQLQQAQLDLQRMQQGESYNDIRTSRDEPKKYDWIDTDLHREIAARHADKYYPSEAVRQEAVVEEYKKRKGRLGSWPDAPVGNPAAMQLYMQEHQGEAQEAQQLMGTMAQGQLQGAQASEQQDQQFARDQMNQMAQGAAERAGQAQQADDDAKRKGEMRIPQVEDAGPRGLRKAVGVGRRIIVIGE